MENEKKIPRVSVLMVSYNHRNLLKKL